MVNQYFSAVEFESAKREIKRIDKKEGNHAALWFVRGLVFANKLDTRQMTDLIRMIWAG